MGLGKSRIATVAAGSYDSSTLVVCPASLKLNWKREIEMVFPTDAIQVVDGGEQRAWMVSEWEKDEPRWVIINYDVLGKHAWLKNRVKTGEIGTVILDEAHYIKDRKAQRTKDALEVVKDANRVYALTGTPIMNRPIELFTLLQAIKHPLGKYVTHFAKRYCGGQMKTLVRDKHTGRSFFVMPDKAYPFRMQRDRYQVLTFMDENGATRIPELKEITKAFMLRRTKAEVLDLPEKIIATVECGLESEWQQRYDNAWDQYVDWLAAHPEGKNIENIMSAQQLVELMKLKQVCSQAKVPMVAEQVKEANAEGESVIIFTQFTKTLDELRKTLGPVVGTANIYTLDGSNDMQEREHAVRGFQGSTVPAVFIGNIKAAGVGITLTKASTVIFADMDWSPAVNEQAEDRAHRIGQTGTVNVYYHICRGTIEEDIARVILDKQGTIGELMGENAIQGALAKAIEKRAE